MKFGLVVATNRDVAFLNQWTNYLSEDTTIYIIEDNESYSVEIPKINQHTKHYCHYNIDSDLKDKSWIIPRGTSAIKSYGFYRAYLDGCDIISCLDDDCFPYDPEWQDVHRFILSDKMAHNENVYSTCFGFYPRGFPYFVRSKGKDVVLSVGGWTRFPDIDGKTEINDGFPSKWWHSDFVVPKGSFFPMCGMNIAFKREVTPLMYFGLQGKNYPYDRYDDIWCGMFAKAVLDNLDKAVHVGNPIIDHNRKSKPEDNFIKESPGYEVLERFVQEGFFKADLLMNIMAIKSYKAGMIASARRVKFLEGDYFKDLSTAMETWARLF